MSKQLVAVDFDDVICPTSPLTIDFYNRTFGTNLTLRDAYTYDHPDLWLADHQTALRRINDCITRPEILQAAPVMGAIEVIQKLSATYGFVVVTGRAASTRSFMEQWLQVYFGNTFTDHIFMEELQIDEPDVSKLEVCNRLGATFLIDDTPAHLEGFDASHQGVLFGEYPWNQISKIPRGVTRCKDWAAVLEYFDGRS